MKYFSKKQILESLGYLAKLNQFFGFTFLAAKRANLPVGSSIPISLDALNQRFLEDFYQLNPNSRWFFRVFRYNSKAQYWVRPNYAGKGLQKLNTTTFKGVFIHEKKAKSWGWDAGYIDTLASLLPSGNRVPAYHLAVWILRKNPWDETATRKDVINFFFANFNITPEESSELFTEQIISNLTEVDSFQSVPVPWKEIESEFEPPPDVEPEKSGILTYLEIDGVGPVTPLIYQPGRRLNIITGDNGLGKTFLLEVAWWTLTGKWAERAAYPNRFLGLQPKGKIKFSLSGPSTGNSLGKPQIINYSNKDNKWPEPRSRETISGLVVYARVDGSFAVWDPTGNAISPENDRILLFNREQVWDGKQGRIEGLIRDWTNWQGNPNRSPFDVFQQVLACMSPPEMGTLEPGEPVRLPFDPREIPTIKHSYGEVPVLYESAGIRRIITLAYLMVWAWNEHRVLARQLGRKVESRMVVMVDEIEAHLHPRWQRVILPALLKVSGILSSELEMQLMAASHSPLVLASAEPVFDTSTDKLFHLESSQSGSITFREAPFVRYGPADAWLTSNLFNLKEPRSSEGQDAISRAIALQQEPDPDVKQIQEVSNLLADLLPPEDKFWARWIFFAQRYGVKI